MPPKPDWREKNHRTNTHISAEASNHPGPNLDLSLRVTYMQVSGFVFDFDSSNYFFSKPRMRGEGKSNAFSCHIQIKNDQLNPQTGYDVKRPTKRRL